MFEIPADQLPPGFADTLDDPPDTPVEPRPASTTVLLRQGGDGIEVLLMRRHGKSGFVPGAWVFPGGRVDESDGDPGAADRIRGLAPDARPPVPFWTAALRELFEETGVLLARRGDEWAEDAWTAPRVDASREALLSDDRTLLEVAGELDVELDATRMAHFAHWVTPVVEPRRYDTHFFVAALPPGQEARHDPREMTDAVWLDPAVALERFERGRLPMVFPTIETLAALMNHRTVDAVLEWARRRTVPRILPRLVRTDAGVGIVVDDA